MLEDIHIINIIKECIKTIVQYTTNERQFDLQLHDSDSYLILKITTHKQNNQLPLLSIKKSDLVRKADIITNENNEVELRVLFFTKWLLFEFYKKYITSKPNVFNNYFNPPKTLKINSNQLGKKFGNY